MKNPRTLQLYVSDRDISEERMKEAGVSKEKALSRIITRRSFQGGIRPTGCHSLPLSGGERGQMFEITGRSLPLRPKKLSRSMLIKRRMNSLTESQRSK